MQRRQEVRLHYSMEYLKTLQDPSPSGEQHQRSRFEGPPQSYHEDADGCSDARGSLDDPLVLLGVRHLLHHHHRLSRAEKQKVTNSSWWSPV